MPVRFTHALPAALALVATGCACEPPRSDAGSDAPIVCLTNDEILASAEPRALWPGALAGIRDADSRGGTYVHDWVRTVGNGGLRIIGAGLREVHVDGTQAEPMGRPTTFDGPFADEYGFDWGTDTFANTAEYRDRSGQILRWTHWAPDGRDWNDDPDLTEMMPDLDLRATYWDQPEGAAPDVPFGCLRLHRDELLWMVRQPWVVDRAVRASVFLHLFEPGGTDRFGPEGLRLRQPVNLGAWNETTYEVADDGSFVYLADWAPMERELFEPPPPVAPDGDRRGPRVVRVSPTGGVAISPILVDPGEVLGDAQGVGVSGHWSALDDEGAYLVHLGVVRADVTRRTSVFARVLPDGTLAWIRTLPEPYSCVLNGELQYDPAIAYDGEGGIAFAFTNGSAPYEIRVGGLDREGNWTLGESGMLVRSFPPTTERPGTRLKNLEMDVDGEGGFFVMWTHEDRTDHINHYAADGTELWPEDLEAPVTVLNPWDDTTPIEMILRHDGLGGVWAVANPVFRPSTLQHLDADARPLFWWVGGESYWNAAWQEACWGDRLPVVAWPDPDAPPIPYYDGAPIVPRPTTDAGTPVSDAGPLDAGMDAPELDAGWDDAPASGD